MTTSTNTTRAIILVVAVANGVRAVGGGSNATTATSASLRGGFGCNDGWDGEAGGHVHVGCVFSGVRVYTVFTVCLEKSIVKGK